MENKTIISSSIAVAENFGGKFMKIWQKLEVASTANLIFAIFGIFGFFIFLWATAIHNIGIRTDSVAYIWTARNLASGIGLGIFDGLGNFRPIVHWPPLYPALLAGLQMVGLPAEEAARWLGAFLTGVTIFCFGKLIYKFRSNSLGFSLAGVLILLATPMFWNTYLYAMTEPLFIGLNLLAFLSFDKYASQNKEKWLILTGIWLGLGFLTRYVGVYLIASLCLALLLWKNLPLKTKFLASVRLGLVAILPMLVWSVRNFLETGSTTNRRLHMKPITGQELEIFLSKVEAWFAPLIKAFKFVPLGLALTLLIAFIILCGLIAWRRGQLQSASQPAWWKIFLISLVAYGFFVVFSRLFLDASIPLEEDRIFFPAYMFFILLVICFLAQIQPFVRPVLGCYSLLFSLSFSMVALTIFLWGGIRASYGEILDSRYNGFGLNGVSFQSQPLNPVLRSLQLENPIYLTDNVERVYWINQASSQIIKGPIDSQLADQITKWSASHQIVIVLFRGLKFDKNLPELLPQSEKIYSGSDGTIIVVQKQD
jgi:4-amino-4-deoxy-L-arabinose transferase-like glycosyltransferase